MLLPGTALDEAQIIAERVRLGIAEAWLTDVGRITLSIGVAAWNGSQDVGLEGSLKQADAALYEAKNAGRNCVIVAAA
ncbi:Probable diguanylate cyclase YdaM [Pantoea agglomerans]|uniref:diguanylate cyclase n=3 Tax=Pantoea TaxID=53335 RepID=A0A379ADG0_ENTAG|nr:Probable diguanylate cyclase YdaM [Pantoea agglomerans]